MLLSFAAVLFAFDLVLNYQITLNLIQKIPSTFWGVLAGSFFTLFGLILSNNHDREIRKTEREYALRRDIYLSAMEPISIALSLLGRLPDLEIPSEKLLEPYTEKSPAIAKASLIAEIDTHEALTKFQAEYASTLLRMITKRVYLIDLSKKIKTISEQIDNQLKEGNRLLGLQKDSIASGSLDIKRNERLTIMFNNNSKMFDDLSSQRIGLTEKLTPLLIEFTRECSKEIISVRKFTTPLLACVRKELKIPFDIINHDRILSEADSKILLSLEEFIKSFDDITLILQRFFTKNVFPNLNRLTQFMYNHNIVKKSNYIKNYYR